MALLTAQRPEVQVFNELLVQYPTPAGLGQVVPDNLVILSARPVRAKGSFNLPFESARPFWVLESVSVRSKGKDYEESFHKYESELKVPYGLLFYPDELDLRVYRHGGRRCRRLKPNAQGQYPISELDLEVGLRESWVRFWYKGKLLPLPGEMQQRLRATTRRAKQESRRAEQESQRADQERERREAAEAEIERLRALLEE